MIKIVPRKGEKIQQTLKRFRKILEKEGVIKEMKRITEYESPSEVRSRIRRKRKREQEKEVRRMKLERKHQ